MASEQERRDNARATIEAKRVGEQDTLKSINEIKKKTEGIVVQMTDCYKSQEESLLKEIADKSMTVSKQKETIKEWQGKYQQLRAEKEKVTAEKDEEI